MTTLKELVDSLTTASRALRDRDIAANPDQPELWTNEPTLFPPATPDEIDSVELRLGAHLDPLHRELLTITNGWHYYNGWQCFLSTSDILLDSPSFTLTGISWDELRNANWAFWDSLDEAQHPRHPLPTDRETFIPIATPTAGYGDVPGESWTVGSPLCDHAARLCSSHAASTSSGV
ncbi:SMI1/KNR4 family protein [Gordonia sp. L191]|uniref:SMI1/KNR4 family protein n=1 Tax=Gordonia sp. L191 TaxID=2982699 RepID=UPI0024BF8EF3|nr:SMI1/KNR4 family protein [Gordonia sp. L191]WHU49333.1 SMI1/KNR4 family protein [Gordonia sp. L191]